MSSPVAADKMTASLPGRHLTTLNASSSPIFALHVCLPVKSSHTRTVPSSPPLASQTPEGSIAKLRTLPSWPQNNVEHTVGQGFSSLGRGRFGSKDAGSILSLFLRTRGARYRSNERSNLSLINFS